MSTITATLEPDADGTLHLPLPAALRHGKMRVTATVQPIAEQPAEFQGSLLDALIAFEKSGGLRDVIPDPILWQRDQREDRALAGRE